MIEGDCLELVNMLRRRYCPKNITGFIIVKILNLVKELEFYFFNYVKRDGNKVVYLLAKW